MDSPQSLPEQNVESNDPFGSSLFSIHRSSVKHVILLAASNALLIALTVTSSLLGNPVMIALSATTMITVMAMTALVVKVGIRTIAVEAWIRRLGMGDLEYRVEPWGNDEVSKACMALETLRLRSIEVVRLQLVEKLSTELETKNQELEHAMAQLREAQDQLVANQKLSEMVKLASGVAHEMRNPLNFVTNFCEGSAELLDELMESLDREERDPDEVREISSELRANMDHIRRNVGRADLSRMVRNSGVATQIEFGQRRSFYAADLVLEGTDAEGITHYVDAEGAFTADHRDTNRARRNAEFLTRFTGCTAHPMVASVSNDHEVQELVNAGAINWFQLDPRELEAE